MNEVVSSKRVTRTGSSDGFDEVLVDVRNLKMYFPITEGVMIPRVVAQVKAVNDVSFQIYRGETLGIVGESGCGKTTTGRCILQLEKPTAGEIISDSAERQKRVHYLLNVCGLATAFADRYPHEMSGGQRQRVGIARALAMNPEFIICDEAVSALDVSIQAQVINLLEDLRDEFDLTYMFISHDLSVVRHISHRVAVMYLGNLVELADGDELFENPMHPYTRLLLNAVPIPDPDIEKERAHEIIQGEIPSPINPPPGCVFHPRCPMAVDGCSKNIPQLREVKPGHWVACSEV
ncbi:MAG: ABC transporter ATP-binding protein [Rhodospirillales bacterium]